MTRIDHTNCLHPRNPVERKACRMRRHDAIKACQVAYLDLEGNPTFEGQREYGAMVELLSYTLGVDLAEAYQIVEHGPVIH